MNSKDKPLLFTVSALGCRTNQYEVEAIKRQLRFLGFQEALEGQQADLCIINTCSVTEGADSSSRHAIYKMQRNHPSARIVVTGCMVDDKIASSFDGDVIFIPNIQKENIVQQLYPDKDVCDFSIDRFDHHTRAFLKVQDGCNSFCSYCVIPFVRGRSRARPLVSIVDEAKRLVEAGYQEIVITGINVGDYRDSSGVRLADVVRAIDDITGLSRLRISSIDPDEVDSELLDAVLLGKHTCPSMHIVLQSGSNQVLKRMNRKYTKQQFFDTVSSLQRKNKNFTFTTDVIVGFPGESEADFLETVEVVEKVSFAKVHIFPYSDRPNTRASAFLDKVSIGEIQRRRELLSKVAETTASKVREKYVGKRVLILTEHAFEKEGSVGHTDTFLEVHVPSARIPSNQLVSVSILQNGKNGLVGELIHE